MATNLTFNEHFAKFQAEGMNYADAHAAATAATANINASSGTSNSGSPPTATGHGSIVNTEYINGGKQVTYADGWQTFTPNISDPNASGGVAESPVPTTIIEGDDFKIESVPKPNLSANNIPPATNQDGATAIDPTPEETATMELQTTVTQQAQQLGNNALANKEYVNAVFKAFHGRDANQGELTEFTGKGVLDVYNAISGGAPMQPGTGTSGATTPTTPVAPTTPDPIIPVDSEAVAGTSVLDQMTDLIDNFFSSRNETRTQAEIDAGVAAIESELETAQNTANETLATIETMQADLDLQNILNQEAQVALKNKLEGQTVSMNLINKQLTTQANTLNQEQRIDRLYDIYALNTQINAYNSQLRNIELIQGKYAIAQDKVQQTVDDWTAWQDMKLNLLELTGQIEEKERARLQQEVDYQRQLALDGFVHIENVEVLNSIVKDLNITAGNFSQFIFKDPATGKMYLRPTANLKPTIQTIGGRKVSITLDAQGNVVNRVDLGVSGSGGGGGAGGGTSDEEPLSINQIDQFRRSYGWTPPFGFTPTQLLQYMSENPNATPKELEDGLKEFAEKQGDNKEPSKQNTEAQFLSKQYLKQNIDKDRLKEIAKEEGFSSFFKASFSEVNRFLNTMEEQIKKGRDKGTTDNEMWEIIKERYGL